MFLNQLQRIPELVAQSTAQSAVLHFEVRLLGPIPSRSIMQSKRGGEGRGGEGRGGISRKSQSV